jgi:hypothetical protein
VEKAKSFDGPKLRDTLETMDGFQGTTGVYHFSAEQPSGHHGKSAAARHDRQRQSPSR